MGHFDELLAKKVGAFEARLEDVAFSVTTVAAAGNSLATAGAIPASATLVNVTGADGTKAVSLPALSSVPAGKIYLIYVNGGTTDVELFPQAADKCAVADDGDNFSVAVNTLAICFKIDDTQWGLAAAAAQAE